MLNPQHIRRKLEAEFGDALHIIPDDKGKSLVYPDNPSVPELVKAYHGSKIHILESDRNEKVIDKAALQMRGDVKKKRVQTDMATSNSRGEDEGRRSSFNDRIPAHIADRYNRSC